MPTPSEHLSQYRAFLGRRLGVATVVGAILVIGAAVSFAAAALLRDVRSQALAADFARRAADAVRLIDTNLRSYEETLYSLRILFGSSDDITRAEFAAAARDLRERHPGIQALEWVPFVQGTERADFEKRLADAGIPDPRIKRYTPNGGGVIEAASESVHYFPVEFIDPQAGNERAIGFNLGNTPSAAILASVIKSGQIGSRGPVLVLETNRQERLSYLSFLPVYQDASAGRTFDNTRGFVMAVFRSRDVFSDTLKDTAPIGEVAIFDTNDPADPLLLYHSGGGEAQPAPTIHDRGDFRVETIHRLGRTWEFWLKPDPKSVPVSRSRDAAIALLAGLLLTGLTSIYVKTLLSRARVVEQEVSFRTAELRATQTLLEDDIRRRTVAEQALADSQERYRAFITHSSEGIWCCALPAPMPAGLTLEEQVNHLLEHGALEECNDAFARMYGYDSQGPLRGALLKQLLDPSKEANLTLLRRFLSEGYRLERIESHEQDRHGNPKIFINSLVGILSEGRLIRAWGTQFDVTAQREAESQRTLIERRLLESQKLESIGVLAGGIAHDFNNLLTGILGNANLLSLEAPPGTTTADCARQIEESALRAAELCRQMLAYAGKGQLVIRRTDLSELVDSTLRLLQLSIRNRADLKLHLRRDLPAIEGDTTQLRQIVMNLVVNASEAITTPRGHIEVTTDLVAASAIPDADAILLPARREGRYVCLTVTDDGCGMTPEIRARIFDPFFTTKATGSGLGLAATLGIVRRHDGGLCLRSHPGTGSTFSLYLPAAEGQPESLVEGQDPQAWTHPGTALIIDDELPVRTVLDALLHRAGMKTWLAEDGETGLRLLTENPEAVSVVLLDLSMPNLSGADTLKRLRVIAPRVPVLLMSGYNRSEAQIDADLAASVSFLPKPFTRATLFEQLRRLLA